MRPVDAFTSMMPFWFDTRRRLRADFCLFITMNRLIAWSWRSMTTLRGVGRTFTMWIRLSLHPLDLWSPFGVIRCCMEEMLSPRALGTFWQCFCIWTILWMNLQNAKRMTAAENSTATVHVPTSDQKRPRWVEILQADFRLIFSDGPVGGIG